jgi:hypothetical protein
MENVKSRFEYFFQNRDSGARRLNIYYIYIDLKMGAWEVKGGWEPTRAHHITAVFLYTDLKKKATRMLD